MSGKRSGVGSSAMALYLVVLSMLGRQRGEAAYWMLERSVRVPLPLYVNMCVGGEMVVFWGSSLRPPLPLTCTCNISGAVFMPLEGLVCRM